MKKVYQRIIDPMKGDCFKCCICSILELDYDDVPNFVESEHWFLDAHDFCLKHGYELYTDTLWNPNVCYLENPANFCFKTYEPDDRFLLTSITPDKGVDGYFMATVYSPKYTNGKEHPMSHLHAVICDIDFNIVHDPNPEYQGIIQYPYAKIIGYNGIRTIDTMIKIEKPDE
jgi:hypothetical protein